MPFNVALIAALVKILAVVGYIMLIVPMLVWLERKLIADFQNRIGPSRVGPFGLIQCFADGIKLVLKENLVPAEIDRLLYFAAPVVVMIPALCVAAVVPFGPPVELFGHTHKLVIADLPVGLLFILALTSLSVYGIVLSGWSSNNKYSLLGGLRSAAQMVSYELPMGFSLIAGLLIASAMLPFKPGQGGDVFTLSLNQITDSQAGHIFNWAAFNPRFAFVGMICLIAFYICGLAETNRAPFDLPEAETELIGGYHTEYGGLRWAMFFLGEYAAMLNVSAVATVVFLGGWHAPYPDQWLNPGSIPYALHGILWFGIKIFTIIAIYIWLRASLPRLRYDRLMEFTWKRLMPTTLAIVVGLAFYITLLKGEPAPEVLARGSQPVQLPTAPMPEGVVPPFGAAPGGAPGPGGMAPGGMAPGMAPGGAAPGGMAPGGMAPGGMAPGGAPAPGATAPTTNPAPATGGTTPAAPH